MLRTCTKGFTLVELIVSISIMAILSGVAVAGASRFTSNQSMRNAENDFVTILQTAKAHTQTQVKPPDCTLPLLAWWVRITFPRTVELLDYCYDSSTNANTQTVIQTYTLPNSVTFKSVSDNSTGGQTYPSTTYPGNPVVLVLYPLSSNIWGVFGISFQQIRPNGDINLAYNINASSITFAIQGGSGAVAYIDEYYDGRITTR